MTGKDNSTKFLIVAGAVMAASLLIALMGSLPK
jgi:LPXTG-motif cell wall-anchored protein